MSSCLPSAPAGRLSTECAPAASDTTLLEAAPLSDATCRKTHRALRYHGLGDGDERRMSKYSVEINDFAALIGLKVPDMLRLDGVSRYRGTSDTHTRAGAASVGGARDLEDVVSRRMHPWVKRSGAGWCYAYAP